MGASGSGKSTLLNVISTIDRVSSGDIYLEGTNLAAMKENQLSKFRRDKLGFIFQEYNLLDTLTVRENIALPLNLKRASMAKTGNMVNKVSAVLGVTDSLTSFPTSCREEKGSEWHAPEP